MSVLRLPEPQRRWADTLIRRLVALFGTRRMRGKPRMRRLGVDPMRAVPRSFLPGVCPRGLGLLIGAHGLPPMYVDVLPDLAIDAW